EDQVVDLGEFVIQLALVRVNRGLGSAHQCSKRACTRPRGRQAAVTPRSWRLNDEMSRRRKRHWRPFLKAGRMLLRAYSFTLSGLKSRMRATSLLLRMPSSLSMAEPTRAEAKRNHPWRRSGRV